MLNLLEISKPKTPLFLEHSNNITLEINVYKDILGVIVDML